MDQLISEIYFILLNGIYFVWMLQKIGKLRQEVCRFLFICCALCLSPNGLTFHIKLDILLSYCRRVNAYNHSVRPLKGWDIGVLFFEEVRYVSRNAKKAAGLIPGRDLTYSL